MHSSGLSLRKVAEEGITGDAGAPVANEATQEEEARIGAILEQIRGGLV
jgi:hypothetical protein